MLASGNAGWQHVALPLMIWACLSHKEGPRRFMRDWWQLIVFWFGYDSMRAWIFLLYPRVAVKQLFRWEETLFLSPTGVIWPFYFCRWMEEHGAALGARILVYYCSLVYVSHIFSVPVLLMIFWLRRSSLLFRRMLRSFAVLSFLGLFTYIAYPAAAPWWVYENGFAQPTADHSRPVGFEANPTLSTIFQFSANRFAAVPSLHAAYPLLLTLVLARHGARYRYIWLAALYTASMWFACVFLNQHYIVDLLAGAALTLPAIPFAPERH